MSGERGCVLARTQRVLMGVLVVAGLVALLLLMHATQRVQHRGTAPAARAMAPARAAGGDGSYLRAHEASAKPPQPRTRLYFLKTHKCASTSVQRIILAFAMRHNASIALPLYGSNIFFPRSFHPSRTKRTCSHPKFDVMAAHARFDAEAKGFMHEDTFFVSVVRDPADQMESAYHYFLGEICDDLRRQNATFSEYLRAVAGGNLSGLQAELEYPCGIGQLQFLQLYDFGLNASPTPTKEIVFRKIMEIDKAFDLVLVVERLDEGLVLMRDMLGWSADDMLHLKSNYRLSSGTPASEEVRRLAYSWNWADKMLYDHFRAKMDDMIGRREAYFREQVLEFRERQAAFHERCVAAVDRDTVRRGKNSWRVNVSSYVLSEGGRQDQSCQTAAMSELQLFRVMNAAQPVCGSP